MKIMGGPLWIPAAIAILSIIGLGTGLLGDSGHDFVAWIGLSIPVLAIAHGIRRSLIRNG